MAPRTKNTHNVCFYPLVLYIGLPLLFQSRACAGIDQERLLPQRKAQVPRILKVRKSPPSLNDLSQARWQPRQLSRLLCVIRVDLIRPCSPQTRNIALQVMLIPYLFLRLKGWAIGFGSRSIARRLLARR
ncbi:uncharacterized protein BKA55DRAFT_199660 [Fusarium redolens]|uniref:Secreted protein n=1 Tax=Fusarium redolens TaxID=48865 RepID=A0A9P9G525_FUSRE|nr:uncharacterized protein BKA55DRAFT_199660 [Fusarium redolens]KAH7231412.1 hypothetical protein BKA55DRAFT_199660 [Fusarium redolens]